MPSRIIAGDRTVGRGSIRRALMKGVFLTGAVLFPLLAVAADNPGGQLAPVVADQWIVDAVKAGDALTLSQAGDTLRLDYDFTVKEQIQLGHITFNRAMARILLKKPVALTDDQTRVLFEARGIQKARDQAGYVQLLPLIRDESGEILMYEPFPYPHLQSGTANWGKWMTRYMYGAEAGGATQNIFQPELKPTAGDNNAWPNGKLTFIGFELQVQPPKFQKETGTIYLATIELGGMKIPYEHPYAYADAFFKTNGQYRLAAQVATAFQALPSREIEGKLEYDPGSQPSRRQRITIPLGPDGNYWIRFQLTDAEGRVVGGEDFRYNVEGNPDKTPFSPVDAKTAPVLGFLRVNPDQHTLGVYEAGAPLSVGVRVFSKGSEKIELAWKLMPYLFDTALEVGTNSIVFAGQPFKEEMLQLKGQPGRDAYRLSLSVLAGGKEVDKQTYVLGRKTDFSRPYSTRQGVVRDRQYVKKAAYFRTTFSAEGKSKTEDDYVAAFCAYLDEASQITPYVTYGIDLADYEVLPGVYDLCALDRFVDAASDRGCTLTVKMGHVDQQVPFRWLNFTRQRSYDGAEIYHHYYGCFSPVDPIYLDAWLRANRSLYDRYKTHPGFQGYYLMMAGGEWSAILDKPWLGELAGYDPPAQAAFRVYLREQMKLSLEQVNQRWGTTYKAWDEIEPPLPDYRSGTRPDMRLPWLDFCRFKTYLNKEFWFKTLVNDIRTYDTNRVVIVYGGEGEVMNGAVDYNHGGGVPYMPGAGEGVELWEKYRVGAIQEPHHPHRWNSYGDPGNLGWVLDWDLYTMFSIAGAGGLNLHVYYYPTGPLALHYGLEHGYDRYEKFKPIFRELFGAKLVTSLARQVATYQDPSTLYCKHRTSFAFRLPDVSRWFELLTYAGVEYEALDRERLGNYKLVLPNLLDEVLSRDSIEMLDGYVRGGGRLIISGITGRYCPELGVEPYPFLKRLGIPLPAGEYVQQGADVRAKVVEATPLFAKNASVKFFTQTDLRSDPNSEAIRKRFFQWPYRWIPQTDYFGYFRDNKVTSGKVLATFPSGGTAISLHSVGKGEIIVFWGIPDYKPELLPDVMKGAATWAGVTDARKDNAIPLMMEARNDTLKRFYAILWQDKPGRYVQKIPGVPEGTWWVDEVVSDMKLGTFTAQELREKGLELEFAGDYSPLKVVRMIQGQAPGWKGKYRMPADTNAPAVGVKK